MCALFLALINALKALQERIRLLELDKNVTLKRLDHLKEEYQPFSVKGEFSSCCNDNVFLRRSGLCYCTHN